MKTAELEFSEHNFNVLKEAYGELKQQYLERGMAMRKTGDQVRSLNDGQRINLAQLRWQYRSTGEE